MKVSTEILKSELNVTVNETFWIWMNNSVENDTYSNGGADVDSVSKVRPFLNFLMFTGLLLTMTTMGIEITKEKLLHHIKRPIGIVIGMFSQFVVMPLSAFSLLQCVTMNEVHTIGILLMSCCPGGILSNLFAYFSDADISLSVAMTSLSTLMAMGMMPLNLWIYGRAFEAEGVTIPYAKLAITLICVTSPVGFGMLLRWKIPRIAATISKVGVSISSLCFIIYVTLEITMFSNMFIGLPGELYAVSMGLPAIGFFLGYILALVFGQTTEARKAIAIECGVQNAPTALTIITSSFSGKMQKAMIPIPHLYTAGMLSVCTILCCFYQVHKKCLGRKIATIEKKTRSETGIWKCQEANADEPMLNHREKEIYALQYFPEVYTSVSVEMQGRTGNL